MVILYHIGECAFCRTAHSAEPSKAMCSGLNEHSTRLLIGVRTGFGVPKRLNRWSVPSEPLPPLLALGLSCSQTRSLSVVKLNIPRNKQKFRLEALVWECLIDFACG